MVAGLLSVWDGGMEKILNGNCSSCISCSQTSLVNLVHSTVSFGIRIPGWLSGLGQSSIINQVVWLLSSMVLVQSPKCRRDEATLF